MTIKKLIPLFSILLVFIPPASAYSPRIDTIVKKMVRNNGRANYRVVREVTFESGDQRLRAKETWLVQSGDHMKLTVESPNPEDQWKFEIVYEKDKRKTPSSNGTIKKYDRSEEFFEPLFHDRSHRSLMKRMIDFKVLPDWAMKIEPPSFKDGKTKMTEEPFVRLEPAEGAVTYAIGADQNSTGDRWQTTLWVEQDSFLIRKGRLRSKAEFTNEDFQTFSGGLKLPKKQTVTWGDRVARVQLITAEPLTIPKKSNLMQLDSKAASRIPAEQIIKEFYSRFR